MLGQAFNSDDNISQFTDHYLAKTKKVVSRFGDVSVTYAVFMRRPVIFTPKLVVEGSFLFCLDYLFLINRI